MPRKRRPQPNYYLRRTEKARREAARAAAARHPHLVSEKLLEGLDLDAIAAPLARLADDDAE